jgi:hypothetical protein
MASGLLFLINRKVLKGFAESRGGQYRKKFMSIVTCRSHFSRGVPQVVRGSMAGSLFQYIGGSTGPWRVTNVTTVCGAPLKPASHLEIIQGRLDRFPPHCSWILRGVAKNTRFYTQEERVASKAQRIVPGLSAATCAALIPIRKSSEWWSMNIQDRQEIIEARTSHIDRAFRLIPAMARRLLYGRDLGEPFDLVTWFEYAPKDAKIFDDLAATMRSSLEWQFVEREIDIRLVRE